MGQSSWVWHQRILCLGVSLHYDTLCLQHVYLRWLLFIELHRFSPLNSWVRLLPVVAMKLHAVGFNETRFGCTRWKTWEQAGLHVSHERLCSDPYPSPQHLGMLQRYASLEDCMLEVIGYIRYPYRYCTYIVILLPIICLYDNIGNTHGKLDEPLKGLYVLTVLFTL